MTEPSMTSDEYFIFNNETLNIFFLKMIKMIDIIKEKFVSQSQNTKINSILV